MTKHQCNACKKDLKPQDTRIEVLAKITDTAKIGDLCYNCWNRLCGEFDLRLP